MNGELACAEPVRGQLASFSHTPLSLKSMERTIMDFCRHLVLPAWVTHLCSRLTLRAHIIELSDPGIRFYGRSEASDAAASGSGRARR